MFTDAFFEKFGNTIKTGNIFGYPFLWNGKTRRLQFSPKHSANAAMVLICFVIIAIFVFSQTIKCKIMRDVTNLNFLLLCVYASIGENLAVVFLTVKGHDFACWINALFQYGMKFNGKYFRLI